jgi:diacylglycerol kinase family enzyme
MDSVAVNGHLNADRRRVLILTNPLAGNRSSRQKVAQLVEGLSSRGLEATCCPDREQFSAHLAREREHLRCVVAVGGDGTFAEVLNRAPGKLQTLDMAEVNGRRFALMASAGFDAEVVRQVHRDRRGHINRLTYVAQVLSTLRSYTLVLHLSTN